MHPISTGRLFRFFLLTFSEDIREQSHAGVHTLNCSGTKTLRQCQERFSLCQQLIKATNTWAKCSYFLCMIWMNCLTSAQTPSHPTVFPEGPFSPQSDGKHQVDLHTCKTCADNPGKPLPRERNREGRTPAENRNNLQLMIITKSSSSILIL